MSILTVPEGTFKLHNDVFITTLDESAGDPETQRTLRLHFYKKNKFNKKLATLNGYNLSKKNIQYNIAREDNLIMQAIDYHDILSKNMVSSNNCLKEVWNNYFPEMKCNAAMILLLGDLSDLKLRIGEIRNGSVWNEIPSDIVEMVKEELKKEESINNNDNKKDANGKDANKIDNGKNDNSKNDISRKDANKTDSNKIDNKIDNNSDKSKIDNASFLDGIVELYENTIGIKMLDSDFHNLKTQAINILRTSTQCTNLKTYIESKIRTLCPNLYFLIDPLLCARLIVKAGGFSNLAKLPASTIQILGAEKALFRALKSKTNTPKHGILYKMQNVRSMANKIAIAARIDYFGNTDGEYGKRLKEGRTYDICKEVYQEIEKKKQEKEKNEKKNKDDGEKKESENDGKTGEKSDDVKKSKKSEKSEKDKKDKKDKKKAKKSDDTSKSADDTVKSVDESKNSTIDVASNLEKEISKKVKKDIDSTVKLVDKNLSSFDDSMHEKGTKQNNDFLGENKNDPMVVKKKSTKKEKQKKEDKKGGKKEENKTEKNDKNEKDVVSEKSVAKNEKKKDVSKTEKKDKKKDSQTEKKKESKKDDEKSVVSEKSVAKSDKKKDKKKESKKDDDKGDSVVSESKEKTKRKAAVPIPEKKVKKTKEKKEIEGEKEKKKSNKK